MRSALRVALVCLFAAAATAQNTITVSIITQNIDGDTSSFSSLQARPGLDGGISFHEAIAAANNTLGPKVISFAPSVSGRSIPLGSGDPQEFLFVTITGGNLTINGDIDGDGTPDVTLDATNRPYGAGIDIRSSNVTINGLRFLEPSTAILFACTDEHCLPRTISGIRVTNNVIETKSGSGMEVGVWGLLSFSSGPLLSGITFTDFTIEGNTIRAKSAGVGVRPSVGGASRNHATNIVIRNNRITAVNGLDIGAADDSSPPDFSDDSLIENLTIEDNLFENCGVAVDVYGGNLGNQRATVRNVRVANNRVTGTSGFIGMYFFAGGNPRARPTSGHLFDGLVISGNDITTAGTGIELSAGDLETGPNQPAAIDDNTLTNVTIANNNIHGYGRAGVRLWGGFANPGSGQSASRNRAAGIVISGNTFSGDPVHRGQTVGVEIVAGESRNGKPAIGNFVSVLLADNVVIGNGTAFLFAAGRGGGAHDNVLELSYRGANRVEQNDRTVVSSDNADGASGNRIAYPRRHSF